MRGRRLQGGSRRTQAQPVFGLQPSGRHHRDWDSTIDNHGRRHLRPATLAVSPATWRGKRRLADGHGPGHSFQSGSPREPPGGPAPTGIPWASGQPSGAVAWTMEFHEFVECYHPENRHQRKPTWDEKKNPEGRWRGFTYEEIVARDKCSLDIFWLKDESLDDSSKLPDPHVLAAEIAEDLRSALEQIESVLGDLRQRAAPGRSGTLRSFAGELATTYLGLCVQCLDDLVRGQSCPRILRSA